MDTLHWPLTILSKAVHFKNLTGASTHVGLSQPQMSRLILQIEKKYDIVLLDRSAKRKSAWTPAAHRLAEIYSQSARKLQSSIYEVVANQVPPRIVIGTLEGLSDLAQKTAHALLENSKINEVELNVYDQNDLEEKFFNGDVDLIFTSRTPGAQKLKYVYKVGFQSLDQFHLLDETNENSNFSVLSGYEYGRLKKKPTNKILISNSLFVRKHWLEHFGGRGVLPSSVKKDKVQGQLPVLIVATELFNEQVWDTVQHSLK